MFDRYRQIPEGMQDTLPGECLRKRAVEDRIRQVFSLYGYREAQTPLLEYLDVFAHGTAGVELRQMYKTLDRQGNVLVMRPESTTPVLRMAMTRIQGAALPIRLCYVQDILEYPTDEQPLFAQTTQAGVELLGENHVLADVEILSLAIETLKAVGLEHFLIDIGQVDFFRGLMDEAGLSTVQERILQEYVEAKNLLGMELFLKSIELSRGVRDILLRLPTLYGGREVLAEARALTSSPQALAALDRIEKVFGALTDAGWEEYLSIDLGMVHAIHYYSGLIFRGLTSDLGKPLLSGGRYDSLPGDFGREMPAVGFALNVKSLLISLERQGCPMDEPVSDLLLGFDPAIQREALAWAHKQRQAGRSIEILYGADPGSLKQAAAARGIANALYLDQRTVQSTGEEW